MVGRLSIVPHLQRRLNIKQIMTCKSKISTKNQKWFYYSKTWHCHCIIFSMCLWVTVCRVFFIYFNDTHIHITNRHTTYLHLIIKKSSRGKAAQHFHLVHSDFSGVLFRNLTQKLSKLWLTLEKLAKEQDSGPASLSPAPQDLARYAPPTPVQRQDLFLSHPFLLERCLWIFSLKVYFLRDPSGTQSVNWSPACSLSYGFSYGCI